MISHFPFVVSSLTSLNKGTIIKVPSRSLIEVSQCIIKRLPTNNWSVCQDLNTAWLVCMPHVFLWSLLCFLGLAIKQGAEDTCHHQMTNRLFPQLHQNLQSDPCSYPSLPSLSFACLVSPLSSLVTFNRKQLPIKHSSGGSSPVKLWKDDVI